jgi:hypothetical protein
MNTFFIKDGFPLTQHMGMVKLFFAIYCVVVKFSHLRWNRGTPVNLPVQYVLNETLQAAGMP